MRVSLENPGIPVKKRLVGRAKIRSERGISYNFLFYLVGYYVTVSLRTRFRTLPDPLLGRESTNLTTRGAL
jgi:hypothetical protein